MTDPMFHPNRWAAAREAAHRAIEMAREAQERDRVARDEKFYNDALLKASGICPKCKYAFSDCTCEPLPFADAGEVTG